MKKVVVSYGKWLSILLLISGIFLNSCSKDEFKPNDENALNLKNAITMDLPGNPANCDLIAGQDIYAGQVLYSNDEDNLYVQYVTTGEWYLSELHLFVGDLDELPVGKKGNPKIGHFPYSAEYLAETIYTFTIPLNELISNENGCYTIAAHAVVYTETGEEETAWSRCDFKPEIFTLKSLIKKPDGNIFWAVSDGVTITDNTDVWCSIMGTNVIDGNATINLVSYPYFGYTNPGSLALTIMDGSISIEVNVVDDLKLLDTYLFIGKQDDLDSYLYWAGGCPDFMAFPYSILDEYSSTHTFTIPVPASESFEDALGANRWGWLSTYCLQ